MNRENQLKEFIKNPTHSGLEPEKGELSSTQKRVQEIAKECGLKRII